MMESTSFMSPAVLENFLIILAAVILVVAVIVFKRQAQMKEDITELQKQNRALRNRLHIQAENASGSDVPDACGNTASAATELIKPAAGPVNGNGGITPEVVAIITAAVAACGYPPSAIRSIRQKRCRDDKWILAARMAGMR